MGCCIVGAIVFSFIFALWRRIGALFGVAVTEDRTANPAMWRLGETAAAGGASARKLPLISPRFAAALAGGALSIVLAFWVVDHAEHIRLEIACGMHKAGLSGGSENPCMGGDGQILDHHRSPSSNPV